MPRSPHGGVPMARPVAIRIDVARRLLVLLVIVRCLHGSAIPERTLNSCMDELVSPRQNPRQMPIGSDCEPLRGRRHDEDTLLCPARPARPAASHGVIAGNRLCVGSGIDVADAKGVAVQSAPGSDPQGDSECNDLITAVEKCEPGRE